MKLSEFDNGDIVQFSDELYGKGKGAIVGTFVSSDGKEYCVVYPKIRPLACKFMCFLTESKNVVLNPF
jgi:hypothetical protein